MKTQAQRLLEHLKVAPITPMQAWVQLGIYRLGARVFDLKKQGHSISTTLVDVQNQFGETCRVAQYRLESP